MTMIESVPPRSGLACRGQVLLVDDEPATVRAIAHTLSRLGYRTVCTTRTGDAVTLLSLRRFDAVVTDLRLPMAEGGVFATHASVMAPGLPLIVVTGTDDLGEVWTLLGGSKVEAVIPKTALKDGIGAVLERCVAGASADRMDREGARLLADGLVRALAVRDVETEAHSRRVAAWTVMLVQRLGVPRERWMQAELGGLLHDIGKIGVSDTILKKAGKLTEDEWEQMRRHPALGCTILAGIPALAGARDVVRSHHERWDGSGYPDGLAGETIPLHARIFAVADAYDALTNDRPYRKGGSHATAVDVIRAAQGQQFDPQVVAALLGVREAEWCAVSRIFTDHRGDGAA